MNKKQYSESEDSLLNDPIASATECTGLIPSGSSFEEEAEWIPCPAEKLRQEK